MEKDLESVPTASDVPSCIEACAEWSDSELKDAPAHAVDWSPRTIGLTDDQMRSAAMLFGVIILFFAGIGIALTEFMSAERQVALMDCVQIVGDTERLACYDKAATQLSAPFKGDRPFPLIPDRTSMVAKGFSLSGKRLQEADAIVAVKCLA